MDVASSFRRRGKSLERIGSISANSEAMEAAASAALQTLGKRTDSLGVRFNPRLTSDAPEGSYLLRANSGRSRSGGGGVARLTNSTSVRESSNYRFSDVEPLPGPGTSILRTSSLDVPNYLAHSPVRTVSSGIPSSPFLESQADAIAAQAARNDRRSGDRSTGDILASPGSSRRSSAPEKTYVPPKLCAAVATWSPD